jgi:nucleoside-diphosphate-sugar epimerase
MRILVIGGTGFLGVPLVRRLAAAGHEVAVLHRGRTPASLPDGVDHVLGDRDRLADHGGERRRLGPDVVIDMVAYFEAHAVGPLEVFRGHAARTVVLSSGDVYRAYGVFHGTEPGPAEAVPLGDVAAAVAVTATDPRAAGRVYNLGEPVALSEADWVRAVGEAAGWQGEVLVVPRGRLAVPGDTGQDIVMDTTRIRQELGYREEVPSAEALRRTVEWERANPPAERLAFDYAEEDRILAEAKGRAL